MKVMAPESSSRPPQNVTDLLTRPPPSPPSSSSQSMMLLLVLSVPTQLEMLQLPDLILSYDLMREAVSHTTASEV